MQLEVIIQGKGSFTISQKADWTRKEVDKLATRAVELIVSVNQREQFGFGSGSSFHDEVAEDD